MKEIENPNCKKKTEKYWLYLPYLRSQCTAQWFLELWKIDEALLEYANHADLNSLDTSNPDLHAVRILDQAVEKLEETLQMFLEALHNVLEDGKNYITTDFAGGGLWTRAALIEEREELRPGPKWDLDGCDSGNDTRGRMADKFTVKYS